jgi:hypothetical protein
VLAAQIVVFVSSAGAVAWGEAARDDLSSVVFWGTDPRMRTKIATNIARLRTHIEVSGERDGMPAQPR